MNWKSITFHSLLLLMASVAAGFFEPRPDSDQPQSLLLAYLCIEVLLLVVYVGVFAHLAYRAARRPYLQAFLAVLLSEAGLTLIFIVPSEFPPTPVPMLVVGYSVLLVALTLGTLIGARFRLAGHGAAA